jgi:heptosyltransferase II
MSRPLVSVAPGAAHETKRWPVDYWETLVRSLVAAGYDVAVLVGSDYAQAGGAIAAAGGSHAASTAGTLGLQESGAVCRASSITVAGDTGLMHLATAVGTPIVALFGPTVRAFGFFPYRARSVILERDLPCRPCSAQGGPRCPLGHHHCLREITPEMAIAAVRSLSA